MEAREEALPKDRGRDSFLQTALKGLLYSQNRGILGKSLFGKENSNEGGARRLWRNRCFARSIMAGCVAIGGSLVAASLSLNAWPPLRVFLYRC